MKVYLRKIPAKIGRKSHFKWYTEFAIDMLGEAKPRRIRMTVGLDETASKKAAEKAALDVYAKAKEEALKPKRVRPAHLRQAAPNPETTIRTALEEYQRFLAAKGSKWRIKSYIERLTGENESGWSFGADALCSSVTQRDVDQIVISRTEKGLSAGYLHAEIAVLRCAVARAGFPMVRLRRNTLPPQKIKTRILSMDEYHRLMEELEPRIVVTRGNASGKGTHQYKVPELGVRQQRDIKDIAIFLFCTGARWGEMRDVRWGDVDFKSETIGIGTLKQRKGVPTRFVLMPPELKEVLTRRWSEVADDKAVKADKWVFPGAKGGKREPGVCQPLMKAFNRAGLNNDLFKLERDGTFTAHGCRHQHATLLIKNGVPLPAVAKLLGHSNVQMTMRYVNLDHEETIKMGNSALTGLFSQPKQAPVKAPV
jgi:integrase